MVAQALPAILIAAIATAGVIYGIKRNWALQPIFLIGFFGIFATGGLAHLQEARPSGLPGDHALSIVAGSVCAIIVLTILASLILTDLPVGTSPLRALRRRRSQIVQPPMREHDPLPAPCYASNRTSAASKQTARASKHPSSSAPPTAADATPPTDEPTIAETTVDAQKIKTRSTIYGPMDL